MAIDYNSGAGLFNKLGKLVAVVTGVDAAGSTGPLDNYDEYIDLLTELTDENFVGSAINLRTAFRAALAGQNQATAGSIATLLNGEITTQEGLGADRTAIAELVAFLRYYMGRDKTAVLENVPALSAATDHEATPQSSPFTNTGNGIIILTVGGLSKDMTVSAGATVETDVSRYAPHTTAQLMEGVLPDDYTFICKQDAGSGASAGAEKFSVNGTRLPVSKYDYDWKHAGNRSDITVVNSGSGSLLTNGGFESVTGSGWSSWTLTTGTFSTHFFDDTTNILRGGHALKIVADASTSPILTSSTISGLVARKKYLLVASIKRLSASTDATSTITVELTGTGWSPTSGEKISKTCHAGGTLSASFDHYWAFINTPETIPSDVQCKITLAKGGGAAYAQLAIDEVLLIPVTTYEDGLSVVAVAGSTDFALNDRFTQTVTNAMPGLFQTFFARFFGLLLPSAPSGTTGLIDEALAAP